MSQTNFTTIMNTNILSTTAYKYFHNNIFTVLEIRANRESDINLTDQ